MSKSEDMRIFIVEDDPMVQRIIKEFIQKLEGFSVAGAAADYSSAQEALEALQPDLVLLDIYLPDGLGIDLLKWIRSKGFDVDAILITADTKATTLETAMRYGAWDYLVKPFLFDRFREALEGYRGSKGRLLAGKTIDQSVVDRVMKPLKKLGPEEPKNQTAEAIMAFLENSGGEGFTASQVAAELGISRITARRYLEEMEKNGQAVLELSYGGVGRPQNKYRIAYREDEA